MWARVSPVKVILDGANPGEGASPMEMILLAVGGCSSIDVVSILEKARQSVTACHVELAGERADSVPRVFEKIHLHFVVTGKGWPKAGGPRGGSVDGKILFSFPDVGKKR